MLETAELWAEFSEGRREAGVLSIAGEREDLFHSLLSCCSIFISSSTTPGASKVPHYKNSRVARNCSGNLGFIFLLDLPLRPRFTVFCNIALKLQDGLCKFLWGRVALRADWHLC
jgi:hypothetical protein